MAIRLDFKGKNALVTGGSRGIGRAICLMLAEAGADVAFGYHRDAQAARSLVAEIENNGRRALAEPGDLAEMETCRALFDAASRLGSLDIVVANAGIWQRDPIDHMPSASWRRMMAANLDSLYHTCHLAARTMISQAGGNIVIIASTAGQRGEAFHAHYAASKGAAIALTRSLAAELGPHGINVNCVAPGWVLTDMTAEAFSDPVFRQSVSASIPLKRIATPEDIAGPVVFLASRLARHIQGAVINVNGGTVLC